MPYVSIVIPAHNAAPFIKETVRSVQAQTFKDFELLIINDGSVDETATIVDSLTQSDARIKLYSTSNQGVERARNFGAEKASGDWIAFLDSDDLWKPEKLQHQLDFLREYPMLHMTSTYGKYVSSSGKHLGSLEFGPPSFENLEKLRQQHRSIQLVQSSVLCKRQTFLAIGGFNPMYGGAGEDLDLWTRVAYEHPTLTLPEHLVSIRMFLSGAQMNKWRLMREHELFIRQNLLRQRDNKPAMSLEQFVDWFQAMDDDKKQAYERAWQSTFYYRLAGFDFLEGKFASGTLNLVRSLRTAPTVAFKKLTGHFSRTYGKTKTNNNAD